MCLIKPILFIYLPRLLERVIYRLNSITFKDPGCLNMGNSLLLYKYGKSPSSIYILKIFIFNQMKDNLDKTNYSDNQTKFGGNTAS